MKAFLEEKKIYQIIALFPYVPHLHISAQKRKKFIPDCLWHPTSKIITYKINWTFINTLRCFLLGYMTIRTETLIKTFMTFTWACLVYTGLAAAVLERTKISSCFLQHKILLKPGLYWIKIARSKYLYASYYTAMIIFKMCTYVHARF